VWCVCGVCVVCACAVCVGVVWGGCVRVVWVCVWCVFCGCVWCVWCGGWGWGCGCGCGWKKMYSESFTVYSKRWPALTLSGQGRKTSYPPVFLKCGLLLYVIIPNIYCNCSVHIDGAFSFLQCEKGLFFSF